MAARKDGWLWVEVPQPLRERWWTGVCVPVNR